MSAVIAVVLVGGGTAAVMAATGNSSGTSNNGGPGGGQGLGGGPGGQNGFARGGFGMGGLADALHGDFVVSTGNGGYRTERMQTGTVTAVSATDITVKSTDGYTQSYVVGSGTSVDRGQDAIGKVGNGNTVTVIATLSGQTATATTIEDTTIDSNQFGGPGNGAGAGNGSGAGNGGPGGGFGGPPGS